MKTKIFIGLAIIPMVILCAVSLNAQQRTIKGKVTTFDSIPLINASVKVKSSNVVVATDSLGTFQVLCESGDKLKITANGFISRNLKLNDEVKLVLVNLNLKPSEKSQEVAVGYGHISRDKLTFAISSVSAGNDFSRYNTMYDLIRVKFPNVKITPNGEITLRGVSSMQLSNAALIVVDGITVDKNILTILSPSNIKSIDILKDASSSMYGARGSNGVVVIETKAGGN